MTLDAANGTSSGCSTESRAKRCSSAILQRSDGPGATLASANDRPGRDSIGPATQSEVITMSKGMDAKKNSKKKPLKTAQEKRMAKRDKKSGSTTLLGTHAATH